MKRSNWKGPVVNRQLQIVKSLNSNVEVKRYAEITLQCVNFVVKVHNGRRFVKVKITNDMIGHKFGEFAPTRERCVFRKKSASKKTVMGQKANPNILRLSVTENWKTIFFEKKLQELPQHLAQDLELTAFLKRFLKVRGLDLHDYKIQYTNTHINIYISYFVSAVFIKNKTSTNLKLVSSTSLVDAKGFDVEENVGQMLTLKKMTSPLKKEFKKYSNNFTEFKRFSKGESTLLFKTTKTSMSLNNVSERAGKDFQSLFVTLSRFLKEKLSLNLVLNCVNNKRRFKKNQVTTLKKNVMSLQKFKNLEYFSRILNVCFTVLIYKDSAKLLTSHLALELKTLKRHRPLLSLLKRFFSLFFNTALSKIQGVKVTIKGKLNGAPRAKYKTIVVGRIPTQTLKAKISYSQTTVNNLNGSYGIKVWITEKLYNKICFCNLKNQKIEN